MGLFLVHFVIVIGTIVVDAFVFLEVVLTLHLVFFVLAVVLKLFLAVVLEFLFEVALAFFLFVFAFIVFALVGFALVGFVFIGFMLV